MSPEQDARDYGDVRSEGVRECNTTHFGIDYTTLTSVCNILGMGG